MRLTISFAINIILCGIILYLLSIRACNPCPETSGSKTRETTVATPVDTNKVHGGAASVVVKKGIPARKGCPLLPPVEDQSDIAFLGDTDAVSHGTADTILIHSRDTLLDITASVLTQEGKLADPKITYRFLKPYRYDHYIETVEYKNNEPWLRLYAGLVAMQDSSRQIRGGVTGSVVLSRLMVDYSYLPGVKQHQVGLKARLFGK